MNCKFLMYSLQVQDWTTWYLQHNGMTNYETEMCMWKWLVLLQVIGNCFLWRWEEHYIMQMLTLTCSSWGTGDSLHFWHCLLFSVSSISLTKYWLCISYAFIYAKQSSCQLAVWKRESGGTHARNCVNLSKIENSSYYQEHVSHPMPVCWWIE